MHFSEFLKDLSIIIASCTAIFGIGSWRREYVGKKRSELAEETLCLFYEARDAVQHIRSPFGHSTEGNSRKADKDETPEEKEAYDRAYVLIERFNSHIELFNKMHSIRYRFMAQFGVNSGNPFTDFRRILNEIQTSAHALAKAWANSHRYSESNKRGADHFDFVRKQENIFWEMLPEQDTIKQRVEICIDEIENICRPIIDNKSLISSIRNLYIIKKIRGIFPKK